MNKDNLLVETIFIKVIYFKIYRNSPVSRLTYLSNLNLA